MKEPFEVWRREVGPNCPEPLYVLSQPNGIVLVWGNTRIHVGHGWGNADNGLKSVGVYDERTLKEVSLYNPHGENKWGISCPTIRCDPNACA
jgi:hypothetical protein